MKLEGCFYKMLGQAQRDPEGRDLSYQIRLLPDNEIFRAHFPEYPITPGAIQVRIATELLQKAFGALSLQAIPNLKFIAPLFPNDELTYSFTDIESSGGTISAELEISASDGIRSKMNLEYAAGDCAAMLKRLKCCVIIPCYDNARTVRDVAERALRFCRDVIVVDDGSTDGSASRLEGLDVKIVRHQRNRGKGQALKTGFRTAAAMGFERAITLDSDGQHYPEDIPAFAAAVDAHPDSMLIGCRNLHQENMPGGNAFANRFSNFWFRVQTGRHLYDTQCGFRLYQLNRLGSLSLLTNRYEAELELLVFQCWKGVDIEEVPVNVYYPPQAERVSHFRPFRDFFRITILNIVLCLLAIIYGYPRKIIRLIFHRA